MKSARGSCGQCGKKCEEQLYSFFVCDDCRPRLGLHTDVSIRKYIKVHENNEDGLTFAEEVQYRLREVERKYALQKIKLLHIQERMKNIK